MVTVVVLALDVAAQGVLFYSEFQSPTSEIPFKTPNECLTNYFECFSNWRQYSLDTATIFFFRLVLSIVTTVFATRMGVSDGSSPVTSPRRETSTIQSPLLGVTIHSTETKENLSRDGTILVREVLGPEGRKNASKVAKQKKILDRKAIADFRKNVFLAVAFLINTAVRTFGYTVVLVVQLFIYFIV